MASEPAAQITTYVYAPNGAWIKITRDDGSLLTPEEQAALLKQRSDEASERIAAFLGERKEPTDDVSEVVTYTYATRPELRESFGRGHAGEDGGTEDEEEGVGPGTLTVFDLFCLRRLPSISGEPTREEISTDRLTVPSLPPEA